jgi:hypothetical protein
VIAARWAMLLATALLTLVAAGAMAPDLQPAARRVMVAAVVGLLAPAFRPGIAATVPRTLWRLALWVTASAGLAAIVLRWLGPPAQPMMPDLRVCAMLLLILMTAHTAAVAIETRLRIRSLDEHLARAIAGVAVVAALALLGSLPLWLGPAAELLSAHDHGAIDAALGMSPLFHLGVAVANDLLRNDWFYQHSNLAGLPFSYPDLAGTAWVYAAASSMLMLVVLALRPQFRSAEAAHQIEAPAENAP